MAFRALSTSELVVASIDKLFMGMTMLTEADLQPNIIVKSCCGSRKKEKSANKNYIDKNRAVKRTESTIPMFNTDDVEEGVEGRRVAPT